MQVVHGDDGALRSLLGYGAVALGGGDGNGGHTKGVGRGMYELLRTHTEVEGDEAMASWIEDDPVVYKRNIVGDERAKSEQMLGGEESGGHGSEGRALERAREESLA